MTIYVAEIRGKGIAVFEAATSPDAQRVVSDRMFRDDLMVLTTAGVPLWDGRTSIVVRQALPREEAKWRASHAKAVRQGNIEGDDTAWIVFLVALGKSDRRDG
jgi:hypothetical protein